MGVPDRVVRVRRGGVVPSGSWLYVWVDVADATIAYVGATGLDPELRTHLHLTSPDPAVARVRNAIPDVMDRDCEVLAFRLPEDVPRAEAKQALLARLAGLGLVAAPGASPIDPMPTAIDPIVDALASYVRTRMPR